MNAITAEMIETALKDLIEEFAQQFAELLAEASGIDPDEMQVGLMDLEPSVSTFEDAGVMTMNRGLVLKLPAPGQEIQLTIVD